MSLGYHDSRGGATVTNASNGGTIRSPLVGMQANDDAGKKIDTGEENH